MMPVLKTLTRATWLFRGSAFPKTMTVIALSLVALIAMFIIRIDFNLKANGSLRPTVQRQVFAHENGEIEEVLVDHGDVVKVGQELVRMRNRELDIELERVVGEIQSVASQWNSAERLSRTAKADQRDQFAGQAEEYSIRLKSLKEQEVLLKERKAQLVRTSPVDGIVMDWKLAEKLRARPVVTGQVLVNIADTSKDWELELLMPEKRMKHLDDWMHTDQQQGKPLTIDYVLASDPSTYRTGKMTPDAIHARAQLDTEDGPVVKMRVKPDSMEGITPRPNTTVIAKVNCGRASAAFVWFHEVVEWFQANVKFKYL
ncbi:MAG: efflux RND transporter periplasmic adaptor subunit [Pirellulales bacterium]